MAKRAKQAIHFIGIGGIGMSALARWFLSQGWAVSGSDLVRTELTDELAKEGVSMATGRKKAAFGRAVAVVYSNAVPPDHAEYKEAKKRGLPLFSYPQMVGEVSRRYETVAVAGAHGKSTTTALVALTLAAAGIDPTVLIGTKLREFGGKNFRAGKGPVLVLEADEYARAFLHYSPSWLVVTNIDREHLDVYRDLADIKRTFLKLFSRVQPGGALVLNADDKHLVSLRRDVARIAKRNQLAVHWYSRAGRAARLAKKALQVPGQHNVSNAAAALTLAMEVFKVPERKALAAVGAFKGSWRRYEHKGGYRLDGVNYQVFDDYAHHPTEIRATLAAFREKFPRAALVCVFEPHQADRLKRLFKDFSLCFKEADVAVFVPAYHVAGREHADPRYTSRTLAAAVAKRHPKTTVVYLERPDNISRIALAAAVANTKKGRKEAVVIMMGAGTISDYTHLLLK